VSGNTALECKQKANRHKLKAKFSLYPLDRSLGGSHIRSEHGNEKKSLHCPFLESNPSRPDHSLITVLTELYRFHISKENRNCYTVGAYRTVCASLCVTLNLRWFLSHLTTSNRRMWKEVVVAYFKALSERMTRENMRSHRKVHDNGLSGDRL
jgi:hypothetical protein